jgi:hypothetical protein
MTYIKYEFPIDVWETVKTIINGSETIVMCDFWEIGHICLKQINDNCVEFNPKWAVDIIWHIDVPDQYQEYEVYPKPNGICMFAGQEYLYIKQYCLKYPDKCNNDFEII